jgi:hypothetical protein
MDEYLAWNLPSSIAGTRFRTQLTEILFHSNVDRRHTESLVHKPGVRHSANRVALERLGRFECGQTNSRSPWVTVIISSALLFACDGSFQAVRWCGP